MSALDPSDAVKFGKLIALFGSNHQGEQLAALNRASAFLTARSIGWIDIAETLKQPPVVFQPRTTPEEFGHRADARRCLQSAVVWTEKERGFLIDMSVRRLHPTEKQESWLGALLSRVVRSETQRAA